LPANLIADSLRRIDIRLGGMGSKVLPEPKAPSARDDPLRTEIANDDPLSPTEKISGEEAAGLEKDTHFVRLIQQMAEAYQRAFGPSELRFMSRYAALSIGGRVWLYAQPRKEGCYVYIPAGTKKVVKPNAFFEKVRETLAECGIIPTWTTSFNAAA